MRNAAPHAPERITLDSGGIRAELALPQALAVTALRNLLDNALRHSPASNSVRLEIRSSPQAVSFHIFDRGPGLSDNELALATQRFWRRRSGRGSGLGLSIVAAIVERFSGSFELRRRSDGGLEARLTLPRIQPASAEQAPLSEKPASGCASVTCRNLPQGLLEHLGRLAARDQVFVVDDDGRHRVARHWMNSFGDLLAARY